MKIKLIIGVLGGVLLSACGGGANPGANPDAPAQTTSTGIEGKTQYPAYANPSGPLCEKKLETIGREQYCIEPTSSSIGLLELKELLLAPDGPLVHFSLKGLNLYYEAHRGNPDAPSGTTQWPDLPHFRGMSSKDVYVGQGTMRFEGWLVDDFDNLYTNGHEASELTPNVYSFEASPVKHATLNFNNAFGMVMLERLNSSGEPPTPGDPTSGWNGWDNWNTSVGLLTDWSDAPEETTLYYEGFVTVTGWPGNEAHAGCEVKVTVDIKGGSASATAVSCTEGSTSVVFGGSLKFHVNKSLISGLFDNSVSLSVMDTEQGVAVVDETVTDIAGGIYGSQAASVFIQGASGTAGFLLYANRVAAPPPVTR